VALLARSPLFDPSTSEAAPAEAVDARAREA
jgi:hypothetical protein